MLQLTVTKQQHKNLKKLHVIEKILLVSNTICILKDVNNENFSGRNPV